MKRRTDLLDLSLADLARIFRKEEFSLTELKQYFKMRGRGRPPSDEQMKAEAELALQGARALKKKLKREMPTAKAAEEKTLRELERLPEGIARPVARALKDRRRKLRQ